MVNNLDQLDALEERERGAMEWIDVKGNRGMELVTSGCGSEVRELYAW
jgi:hypothetical protein